MKGARDLQHAAKKYGTTSQHFHFTTSAEFNSSNTSKSSELNVNEPLFKDTFTHPRDEFQRHNPSLRIMTSYTIFQYHRTSRLTSHRFSLHSIKSHSHTPYTAQHSRCLPSPNLDSHHHQHQHHYNQNHTTTSPTLASYKAKASPLSPQPLELSSRSHSHLLRQTG